MDSRFRPPGRRPWVPLALATLLLSCVGGPLAARAETVMERAARTGVISMGGRTDVIPYAFLDDRKQVVGFSLDVADLIAAEVSQYLNRPVRIEFLPGTDAAGIFRQVSRGELDLSCGAQFTWEREMFVDYTIPFSLSGIRVLSRSGRLSGTPESLAGKRIAVIAGSLGEAAIRTLQPGALRVPVAGVSEGLAELRGGKVDGFAADSILLAGAIARSGDKGFELVPRQGYVRYAVGCILPENNSTFRNLANLAIAKLLQGYVDGDKASTERVNRWLGPKGVLELPPELIRDYFQMVLLTHEQIRVPADPTPAR